MDDSQSQSLHTKKIIEIKTRLERKGWRCIKNFPIDMQGRIAKLDLACFRKIAKAIGVEVDADTTNAQGRENQKKLEEFKKMFPNAQACHYSLLSGGCDK